MKLHQSVVVLAIAVSVWMLPVLARAATFTVDRFDDAVAATSCDPLAPNDCSLRGAVSRANASPDYDEIILPAGTYVLSIASACTFLARRGENFFGSTVALCLNSDLKISGAGSDNTIIQGNMADRAIAISVTKSVSIASVTVTRGGGTPFGFQIGGGAGILNHGLLVLSDSIVAANTGGNGGGGGLYNFGTLTIARTLINNNASSGAGGGILNSGDAGSGTLIVESSTISNNTTTQQGGGIENLNGGVVIVSGSTISDNRAPNNSSGGIGNGNFSTLMVTNSTLSGNQSASAGGIGNGTGATTQLNNVTITGNIVGTPGGGGVGGGVANVGTIKFQNTIIAGNTSYFVSPDCNNLERDGDLISLGYNLIQNTANCDISGDTTGNIIGQDANLGLLTENGGPTKTHAPIAGSPVIDAGSPASPGSAVGNACAAGDQRGLIRPLGAACDIGAFERTGAFSLVRVLPKAGGNTGSVSTIISGDGVASRATVKLTHAGQPDIIAQRLQVDVGGSAITATFNLAGRPTGPWNVVVANPDGAIKTLPGGFTIEAGGASDVWVDVVGRFFRPGRPSHLTILYGNRGNVDALAVPVSLSIPQGYAPRRIFAIEPPPAQPGQVRDDFSQVPVNVSILGQTSHFTQIPLLLPVVPAGFSGSLQIGLTLPVGAQESMLVTSIGDPIFNPGLDPQAVNDMVAGAQAYLQSFGVTVPPALVPDLTQYAINQFQQLVESGRAALVTSMGIQPQVYSVSQLHLDLALYGAARVASSTKVSKSSRTPREWFDAEEHGLLTDVGVRAIDEAKRWFDQLLSLLYRSGVVVLSWLGPAEAHAQSVDCPIAKKGEVLRDGCSGGAGPDEPFFPPEIPPPPGCNVKDPSTFKKCKLTPDHCDSLPGYKVVTASNGEPFCVPDKPGKNCSKLAANPVGSNQGCSIFPLRPKDGIDPNDKVGTQGVTAAHFLLNATPLSYTVFFENVPAATAPAQEVVITDRLDTQTMNLDTFGLGAISFGRDVTLVPPPGVQQYTGGVDLRPEQNVIVTVKARLEKSTGILTWRFTSIDPDTGQLTEDPNAGFLPPNVQSPDGEGSVAFTVERKSGLASGTTICNQASVVFDLNAPIATPRWCNGIDTSPPSSTVSALAATQTSPNFLLQWSGSDIGSGISDYTIFVSTNGGPLAPFVTETPNTSAMFTGNPGNSYAFYSVARDQAGNTEALPPTPDTTTIVIGTASCATDVSKQVRVVSSGLRRNAATNRYVQQVTLTNVGGTTISGPTSLVLDNLGSNASLFNRSGDTACASPAGAYKTVSTGLDNVLSAGEIATVVLEFTNPSNQIITYGTRVLSGGPL